MSPPFVNGSCDPFLPQSANCVVGSYVTYSIKVDDLSDVKTGIKFASDNNIRLVIRTFSSLVELRTPLTLIQATLVTTSMARALDLAR